jgi:hypothetical protein
MFEALFKNRDAAWAAEKCIGLANPKLFRRFMTAGG